jgi:hypothetical protein
MRWLVHFCSPFFKAQVICAGDSASGVRLISIPRWEAERNPTVPSVPDIWNSIQKMAIVRPIQDGAILACLTPSEASYGTWTGVNGDSLCLNFRTVDRKPFSVPGRGDGPEAKP